MADNIFAKMTKNRKNVIFDSDFYRKSVNFVCWIYRKSVNLRHDMYIDNNYAIQENHKNHRRAFAIW